MMGPCISTTDRELLKKIWTSPVHLFFQRTLTPASIQQLKCTVGILTTGIEQAIGGVARLLHSTRDPGMTTLPLHLTRHGA
jgi:hypothetical protein